MIMTVSVTVTVIVTVIVTVTVTVIVTVIVTTAKDNSAPQAWKNSTKKGTCSELDLVDFFGDGDELSASFLFFSLLVLPLPACNGVEGDGGLGSCATLCSATRRSLLLLVLSLGSGICAFFTHFANMSRKKVV